MTMTALERTLWDYLEEESNELMIKVRDNVESDGFDRALEGCVMRSEALALKLLSMTMMKTLALLAENTGSKDLAKAYMEMVPLHTELIKLYMLKEKRP